MSALLIYSWVSTDSNQGHHHRLRAWAYQWRFYALFNCRYCCYGGIATCSSKNDSFRFDQEGPGCRGAVSDLSFPMHPLKSIQRHRCTSNQHRRRRQGCCIPFKVSSARMPRAGLGVSGYYSWYRSPYIPENCKRYTHHLPSNWNKSGGRECRRYMCCTWCRSVAEELKASRKIGLTFIKICSLSGPTTLRYQFLAMFLRKVMSQSLLMLSKRL